METCLHSRGTALNARETGIYRLRHARLDRASIIYNVSGLEILVFPLSFGML